MLHTVFFFLLVTSVFAAPVGTSSASVDRYHHDPAEVQNASPVGVWYPIGAEGVTEWVAIEVLPRGGGASFRTFKFENGALLPQTVPLGEELPHAFHLAKYWCQLPRISITFAHLSSCLSVSEEGKIDDIHIGHVLSRGIRTITDWVVIERFNYWYKVPGLDPHHTDGLPIPVLQFDSDRKIVGVRKLGVDGGVESGPIILHYHPPSIEGTYRRLPGPQTPLRLRLDEMNIKVGEGYIISIVVNSPFSSGSKV